MAIVLAQSFNWCTQAEQGWTNTSGITRSTSTVFSGSHSFEVDVSNAAYQYFPLGSNYTPLYMGFHFRVGSLSNRTRICSFHDGSTYQLSLIHESDGSLRLYRGLEGKFDVGTGTSIQQTAAGQITANTWYHIQIYASFHGSTGAYEVRKDGTAVLSGSGVNTSASGNAYADRFGLGDVVPATGQYFDNLVIADNAFQGQCVVETLYPSANGTTNNFNVSGAASNYQAVDDSGTYDSDTTYTYSANVGDIDLYALANSSYSTGTVKGLQVNAVMRKDDAGARDAALVVRSSSTNSVRSTQSLTSSYAVYSEAFTNDPVTSTSFTLTSVNALEIGAKVIT